MGGHSCCVFERLARCRHQPDNREQPTTHIAASNTLQAGSLDFTKAPEPSLPAAVLLGGAIKAAASLLMGAPPEGLLAAGGHSSSSSSNGGAAAAAAGAAAAAALPQELLQADADVSGLPPDLAAAVRELQAQQHALQAELQQR
jgi:hypothetical protein